MSVGGREKEWSEREDGKWEQADASSSVSAHTHTYRFQNGLYGGEAIVPVLRVIQSLVETPGEIACRLRLSPTFLRDVMGGAMQGIGCVCETYESMKHLPLGDTH